MGWGSGGALAGTVMEIVEPYLSDDAQRLEVARKIALAFMEQDCDTLDDGGDDWISLATGMIHKEQWGAPKQPTVGALWTDTADEQYRFDGRRWQLLQRA